MPVKLHNLTEDSREVVVEYGGEECKVTYRPSAFTPNAEEQLRAASKGEGGESAVLVSLLSQMLVSWEVLDDSGEPIGTDIDTIKSLPYVFIGAVFEAVSKDVGPGKARRRSVAS